MLFLIATTLSNVNGVVHKKIYERPSVTKSEAKPEDMKSLSLSLWTLD